MRTTVLLLLFFLTAVPAMAQLYVGIETGAAEPMYFSDLTGFPSVTWNSFHAIDVSGAAARPDGTLYVCNGAFTTDLFEIAPGGNPVQLSTVDKDISGMAFGRGRLYGYSNYATPKGIYEIDPATGVTTLVVDVYTSTGFRFFALGYNSVDDLLYGYTEYGDAGLHSINIDTGDMIKIVGTIPASNGQGRGLAVGDNTVYLTATRGDDGIPFFAYDLAQGTGGSWVGFDNAYPNHHSTGGAAWVPKTDALEADADQLSVATGGTINFALHTGSGFAGRNYLLLATTSGTQPGTLLPGGLATIPLNRDWLTDYILNNLSLPLFASFRGALDGSGDGAADLTVGPMQPWWVGKTLHFAFATANPWDFASNAVAVEVVP